MGQTCVNRGATTAIPNGVGRRGCSTQRPGPTTIPAWSSAAIWCPPPGQGDLNARPSAPKTDSGAQGESSIFNALCSKELRRAYRNFGKAMELADFGILKIVYVAVGYDNRRHAIQREAHLVSALPRTRPWESFRTKRDRLWPIANLVMLVIVCASNGIHFQTDGFLLTTVTAPSSRSRLLLRPEEMCEPRLGAR